MANIWYSQYSFVINKLDFFQSGDDLVVTLTEPKSKIRGQILKSYAGNDFYSFQDIPYAVPPLGNLRFLVRFFKF